MPTLSQLRKHFNNACEKYVAVFAKKHGLEFDYWVGDQVGTDIACFSSTYFFSMDDIIYDVDTKQPKGLIVDWHDESLEYHLTYPEGTTINFRSYAMGARHKDLAPPQRVVHPIEFVRWILENAKSVFDDNWTYQGKLYDTQELFDIFRQQETPSIEPPAAEVSDDWQPFTGEYEKVYYAIRLKDGQEFGWCWPNANSFHVDGIVIDGSEVAFIKKV